jgi:protocatechuate 3,4-dioxygenase beta subunit
MFNSRIRAAFLPMFAALILAPTSFADESPYDRARTLAKSGQKAEALTNLETAVAANRADLDRALVEADFSSIRSEARFRKLFKTHARSQARLTAKGERGDALVVSGVIRGSDNKPIPNAIVYVYQTDHRGYYSADKEVRDEAPRLFGYLKTDDQGRYEFRTIRPGGYPNSQVPQHIHYEVTVEGKRPIVTEFFFPDDPRMTAADRDRAAREKMLATISGDADGTQRATFDVVVGQE